MSSNKRTPLLKYWSTRYLITLCTGLVIIGIVSTFWIRQDTIRRRLESLKSLAAEIAESSVDSGGTLTIGPDISREIERRRRFLGLGPDLNLLIVNDEEKIVYSRPGLPPAELLRKITIPKEQEQGIQELKLGPGARFYILKQAIKNDEWIIGSIYIIYPFREVNRNPEEVQLLFFLLGGLGLLGWLIIYFLTRKLTKPIKKVADAAQQIVKGDYDLALDENVRELEIFELIQAFQDMAERLRQLEALRTELLAGVTHELKTPVTSISGLLQAVRDQVVTGEEAKEFLEICSAETVRLQKMIEDLLDFNSFVSGALKVEKEYCNINDLVREISYQWLLAQEDEAVTINTLLPEEDLNAVTDPMRVRQILYNLFNNAKQAFVKAGIIDLILYMTDGAIKIDIKDNGPGIPPEEQGLIFERFFRGSDKKDRVRGMGLGLSFSKIIAKALGGDLILKSSSPSGTTFTLALEI